MSENSLNDLIESLINEVEKELEEMTTTGDVGGYNIPSAFSDGSSKNKKRKKKIATQLGMKLAGKIDEGMVSPKRGHEFFQLTKDTPIKYITKSYTTSSAPGVLWKHDTDYIDGKKGAYLIDYFGAAFYVDLKKKFASKIYPIQDQDKLSWKSNFIDVDKAPQMSDWKKYLKEDINEEQINEWKLQLDLGKVNPSEFEKWADSSLQKKHKIKVSGSGKNWTITGKGNDDRMGSSANWITQLLGKSWKGGNMRVLQKESQVVNKKTGKDITKHVLDLLSGKINQKQFEKLTGLKKESVNESLNENRWLELKNDDTMHPHKKMAMGLKELKHQLAETEKFFNWYNKIKNINELDSDKYWKRTNNHIYKIKERLVNIAKTLKEIEK